jgi:hypothetical protein
MKRSTRIASVLAAVGVAAALFYAPAASADRIGFNLSLGGPGYAVSFGNYGYGYYDYWRPAPVIVAPYAPYYGSYYYGPPVVHRPYPVYRHHHNHWRNDWHRNRHHHRHDGHRRGHDRHRR